MRWSEHQNSQQLGAKNARLANRLSGDAKVPIVARLLDSQQETFVENFKRNGWLSAGGLD